MHTTAGGKVGLSNKVRPVSATCACTGLLHSRVHGKGRAAHECGDIQHLPPGSEAVAEWLKKSHAVQRNHLYDADAEHMRHIEGGRALFGFCVPGVLGKGLEDGAGSCESSAEHGAGVVK